jgi:hypothetical protein
MKVWPKITLKSYQPLWKASIKAILEEIDHLIQNQTSLSAETVEAAGRLESLEQRPHSVLTWKPNLLEQLRILKFEPHWEEIQKVLNLTQDLIKEIKKN